MLGGVAFGVHAVRNFLGNCAAVTGSSAVFLIVGPRVFSLPGKSEVKAGGQEVSTAVQADGGVLARLRAMARRRLVPAPSSFVLWLRLRFGMRLLRTPPAFWESFSASHSFRGPS